VRPSSCHHATAGDAACRVGHHHWRPRKTGPGLPIAVLRCATHGKAFTVYPMGHVPYGRAGVAPVDVGGTPRVVYSAGSGSPPVLAWAGTVFDLARPTALADAPSSSPPAEATRPPWWMTPWREHSAKAATILGLPPDVPATVGDAIARALELPRLILLDAAAAFDSAHGPDARTSVVLRLLARLRPDRALSDRLLAAGAAAGAWGAVHCWRPGPQGPTRRLFPSGFRQARAPDEAPDDRSAPTKSWS
jgi:hypothetical protein